MSKIPGTFKHAVPLPVRSPYREAKQIEDRMLASGALFAEVYICGECNVILSREPGVGFDGNYGWHMSISHVTRYPTWDEIKTARYGLDALKEVTMAQILGPVEDDSEWVNVHENCFHLYEIGPQPS